MGHLGVICPNASGHLNPMLALADAIRRRGHRVTFFLLGDTPGTVAAERFEVVPLGGSLFPPDEYRAGLQRLGTLEGRAALKHTFAMAARAAEAILEVGPASARNAGITALHVDQASFPGGTVADQLGLPSATVCNAPMLNPDPGRPTVSHPLASARRRVGAAPQPDRMGRTGCMPRSSSGSSSGDANSACPYPGGSRTRGRAGCRSASSRRRSSSPDRSCRTRFVSSDHSGSRQAIPRSRSPGNGSTAAG